MEGEDLVLRFIGLDLMSNIASAIGGKVDSMMKSIGSSGSELGKSFGQVGSAAVGMGGALLGVAAVFTGIVVGATAMAGTFEQKMTLIHTQAGASTVEVQKMSQALLDLAPAVGFGPDKLADALYHVESLGFRGAAALDILKTAAMGAQIGNANLEDTVNALGGAMVAQIGGVSNVQQVMQVLDATVGVGNMRMQDLVSAMSTGVVPAAKNFGLTLQELGGALATLTDNAVPADEAATRLRMTFALLAAPTQAATKQLKSIGISQLELAADMRQPNGLVVALTDLHNHLVDSGKTAEEQSYVITRAFGGGRSSAGIMTLLNNIDRLNQRTQQINSMTGSFGSRFEDRTKNMTFQVQQLSASFERLVIVFGQMFLPILERVIQFITPIISAIGSWIEQHQRLAAAITIGVIVFTALAGIFLVVFGVIAMLLGGILALVVALPMIGAAIVPILTAIGITLGVMLALIAVIALVVVAIMHWQQISDIARSVWGFVGPYVMSVINAIRDAIDQFISATTVWWRQHSEEVRQIWGEITNAVTFAWNVIRNVIMTAVTFLLPFLRTWLTDMYNAFATVWSLVIDALRTVWDSIVTIFTVALDLLTGHWNKAWDDLRSGVAQIWSDIVTAAADFGANIVRAVVQGITGLGGAIGGAIERVLPGPIKKYLGIGNDIGTSVTSGIAQGVDNGKGLIDRAAERSTSSLTAEQPSLTQSARAQDVVPRTPTAVAVPAPPQSGLQRDWDRVKSFLAARTNDISGMLNSWVGSLGSVWKRFSSDPIAAAGYMVGYVIGTIARLRDTVTAQVDDLASKIRSLLGAAIDDVVTFFSQLPSRLAVFLAQVYANVIAWATSIIAQGITLGQQFINNAVTWLSQLPGRFALWLANVIVAIIRWGQDLITQGHTQAQNFGDAIKSELNKLPAQMVQIGRDIINGVVSGIKDMAKSGVTAIQDFVHSLIKGAQDAGKGGSPFMLFADEVGAPVIQGVGIGIERETPNLMRTMGGVIDSLVTPTSAHSVPISPHLSPSVGTAARALGAQLGGGAVASGPSTAGGSNDIVAILQSLMTMEDGHLRAIRDAVSAMASEQGVSPSLAASYGSGQ